MAILSVFIAGLMVGRTPEYLGKKIETREVKLAMLYVLVFPLVILSFAGWSVVAPYALSSLNNAGPHGLSEILYAFTSAAGNNGSAFAGINANTPWYNVSLGLVMLFRRLASRACWPARRQCPLVRARCRRPARCSRCCW
jgi:K+-transporting ATPase ATPase A chain